MAQRSAEELLTDLDEAFDAARVSLGKARWDTERPLRLAGEAVLNRIGDIATKLPDELIRATPEVPWADVRGIRIVVAHAYHGINYETVWSTLSKDVPALKQSVDRWRARQKGQELGDLGPDLGL